MVPQEIDENAVAPHAARVWQQLLEAAVDATARYGAAIEALQSKNDQLRAEIERLRGEATP